MSRSRIMHRSAAAGADGSMLVPLGLSGGPAGAAVLVVVGQRAPGSAFR
jgi:hypothetical protein